MGLNRGDIPNLLTSGLRTEFMGDKGFGMVQTDVYKEICTEVPSTKSVETYAWLGQLPKMREWVDERTLHGMAESNFSITNKDYEVTLSVNRNAIDDDQYGQVKIQAQMLGQEARRFYDEQLATVIEANGLCYDGQNFFDTDHVTGDSGSQSNAPAAASGYDVASAANAITVLKLVEAAMAAFKGDKGKLFGAKVTHVMVPPALEWTMREAFDPTYLTAGDPTATKIAKGRVKVIVNDYLTTAGTLEHTPIYWLDLSKPIKPFIFQNRQNVQFVALDKPDDYQNFMRKEILYGADMRCAFGFGLWQLAYKTTGA